MCNGRFFFAITLKTMERGIYNFPIFGVLDDSLYIKGISTCKSTGNGNSVIRFVFHGKILLMLFFMITETNKVLEMEKYTFLRSLVTVQAAFGAVLFGLSSDTIRTEVYLRAAAISTLLSIFFGCICLYEKIDTCNRILNKIRKGQIDSIIYNAHLAIDRQSIFFLFEWLFYLSSASILISLLLYVCY